MKSEKIKFKILSSADDQCAICGANFEVWLNNQKLNENREENIRNHFLSYCPQCARASGN